MLLVKSAFQRIIDFQQFDNMRPIQMVRQRRTIWERLVKLANAYQVTATEALATPSAMRLRRHKDATTLIELMLARNPNDNQGVRYLLSSEALRAGDHDHARAVFEAKTHSYPPYFYELALCHMLRNDWVDASTALRRGFAVNPYIAEILGGNPNPAQLAVWHGSNLAKPDELAREYMQMYGTLWQQQPDSFAFTRWLFNHPKVLADHAAILECREALL